jgi:hypothetical protein
MSAGIFLPAIFLPARIPILDFANAQPVNDTLAGAI